MNDMSLDERLALTQTHTVEFLGQSFPCFGEPDFPETDWEPVTIDLGPSMAEEALAAVMDGLTFGPVRRLFGGRDDRPRLGGPTIQVMGRPVAADLTVLIPFGRRAALLFMEWQGRCMDHIQAGTSYKERVVLRRGDAVVATFEGCFPRGIDTITVTGDWHAHDDLALLRVALTYDVCIRTGKD